MFDKEIDASLEETQPVVPTKQVVEVVAHETVDMGDPGVVYADYDGSGGIDWIASLSQEAQPATLERTYQVTLTNDGEVLERKVVPGKDVLTPAQPAVMKFGGSVSVGSEFFPRTTTYGVDCIGCSGEISGEGGTAAGVKLSNTNGVLQPNGTWKQGIKYGDYYIVAADRSIPMCSVLEISNHGYSGYGLTPGVPFYAMVLDRGGGIWNNHLDLYAGSQKSSGLSIQYGIHKPKATIVSVGNQGMCPL